MWCLWAAKVTKILRDEKAGMLHFRLSVAPGAAARMHARMSRNFFRASGAAASMYSSIVVGRALFPIMA